MPRKAGGDDLYAQMQDVPLDQVGKQPDPAPAPPAAPAADDSEDDPDLTDEEAGDAAKALLFAEYSEMSPSLMLTKQ